AMATSSSIANKPKPPVVQPGASGGNVIINTRQRLNPVVELIRNVGKEYGEIPADFQVGKTTGVLFLSLRYHRLHPEYIHTRIEGIKGSYNLRVLLLMCDVTDHQDPIRELTKMCIINDITVIVAWSADEAGAYLSTYKQYERKPPNMIKERVERESGAIMRAALTSISKVNKNDVETLKTSFGSFANIARASADQLTQLPGFGPKKVARMKDAFERPFRNGATSSLQSAEAEQSTRAASTSRASSQLSPLSPSQLSQRALNNKGKDKAMDIDVDDIPSPPTRRPLVSSRSHHESPTWDIGLDLNTPSPPHVLARESLAKKRDREPSPIWDIELDLNPSDVEDLDEQEPVNKRRKG
ncbi:restriction endonuclease type II-like protein, partial [Vararia minispora EC-137]